MRCARSTRPSSATTVAPIFYALRALAYGAADRPDEAARALRRAIAIDPRNPTLSYALAQRLAQLKQPADAAQALRGVQRALDERRTSTAPAAPTGARHSSGSICSARSSGAAPIFPQARYAAGFAALESGDYETALATIR